jgi:hypothetical protein
MTRPTLLPIPAVLSPRGLDPAWAWLRSGGPVAGIAARDEDEPMTASASDLAALVTTLLATQTP